MKEIGARVGAILSANETTVYLLGYGTYVGNEVPPSYELDDIKIPTPKILLDNGDVVWGNQCWWSGETRVKELIGTREVVEVKIQEVMP